MSNKYKISLFNILLILTLLTGLYLAWDHRHLFKGQTRLDNKKYPLELDTIRAIKDSLRLDKAKLPELGDTFTYLITHKIFPYWYGTRWDFYGTTQTPNEGSIACGYFVTTTLRDMGVPVNRVKMAQCGSEVMIRSLTGKENIHYFHRIGIEELEKQLKKLGNGLYIVGLDTHTGFILLSNEGNYFIHSSGNYPFEVIKEKLSEASIIIKSKYRVVGKISADKVFLKSWVESKESGL